MESHVFVGIVANHQGLPSNVVHTTMSAQLAICAFDTHWDALNIQETERLVADPAPGITATPHDDNLRYFDVTIQGPDGSPFQSMCAL